MGEQVEHTVITSASLALCPRLCLACDRKIQVSKTTSDEDVVNDFETAILLVVTASGPWEARARVPCRHARPCGVFDSRQPRNTSVVESYPSGSRLAWVRLPFID